MMKFYMLTAGVAMLGFLLPELIVAAYKVRVPITYNLYSAIAFGLIAASVQL